MMIIKYDDSYELEYETFLMSNDHTLIYSSIKYKKFLEKFLGAKNHYLIAVKNDKIQGILPLFYWEGELGVVINSLPFYGSNGGLIVLNNNSAIKNELLGELNSVCEEMDCISATIITSPYDEQLFYSHNFNPTFIEERISLMTQLPVGKDSECKLFDIYDRKVRNAIRKAMKSSIIITLDVTSENVDFLISTHALNMKKLNAIPKPKKFFNDLFGIMNKNADYKLFTAYFNGVPIASLLTLYYNKTVEYFVPVLDSNHRSKNPMNLLIYHAMRDAISNGYLFWNWGGTSAYQQGVYSFKKKWGSTERKYHYNVKVYDDSILNNTSENLLRLYPFFYVVPFSQLLP